MLPKRLLEEYYIKTAEDSQKALKDLLRGTIQSMLKTEFDEHLVYDNHEISNNNDYGNGTNPKKLRSLMAIFI